MSWLKTWDQILMKIKLKFNKNKKIKSEEKADIKKILKERKKKRKNRQILKEALVRAGLEHLQIKKIKNRIIQIGLYGSALLTFVVLLTYFIGGQSGGWVLTAIIVSWTLALGAIIGLSWVILYFFLDLRIFNRTLQLEAVLPDFLQLTSSNISAGMPIDRALWYAVRPNFGVLAKEIEEVAKNTVAGEDLDTALKVFSSKYDSKVLKESIDILLEGLRAGGEMADLLNKIAINIQETRLLRKEMSASVMTYVIFIAFGTAVAAPFLYSLSGVMLTVIRSITADLDLSGSSGLGLQIGFSGTPIQLSDFITFAVIMLVATSINSTMIISVIRKGNIKEGLKFLPPIILVSVVLFFLSYWAFNSLFSQFV